MPDALLIICVVLSCLTVEMCLGVMHIRHAGARCVTNNEALESIVAGELDER
jgi:hypothetical protein